MRFVLAAAIVVMVGAVAAVGDLVRQNDCDTGTSWLGIAGWTLLAAGAIATLAGVRRELVARRWLALAPATIGLLALLAAMGAALIAHSLDSLCRTDFGF
jgi:hypothetical protein